MDLHRTPSEDPAPPHRRKSGTGLNDPPQRALIESAARSREAEIREEVRGLATVAEQVEFLQGACADDPALRERLLAWLGTVAPTDPGPSSLAAAEGFIHQRYRLVEKVGEGGFGVVYRAEQVAPVRRCVALKILKPGMDSREVIARFELERQALALMDHPGIARILDAGATEAGRPYFSMEYVPGPSLTAYCDREKLGTEPRLRLFIQVCEAVQHAHQKGIVHRDLKPSNLLVDTTTGAARPKVIDFGIAKALESGLGGNTVYTREHRLIGTPSYLSPEQAGLGTPDIDTRADIYSLGVLLYELLTGSTPFETVAVNRPSLEEMCRTIREREPVRPSAKARARRGHSRPVASDLDWIVLKCLQKDRSLRYATANGLAVDVQRYLDHEPIVARPPSTAYRFSRLLRRNPAVSGLVLLLLLAITGGLIVGAAMNLRLSRSKQATEQANRTLTRTVRYLESQSLEEQARAGRNRALLSWLAEAMRHDPTDPVAASRALSLLSQQNFALPAAPPLIHGGPVHRAEFSPDETRILTASEDGTVRVWEAASSRLLAKATNELPLATASYAARGTRVVALTQSGIVRVYDSELKGPLWEMNGPRVDRTEAADTATGSWLFAMQEDRTLSRWNLLTGEPTGPGLHVAEEIKSLALSVAADRLAVGTTRAVHWIRVSTGESLGALDLPGHALEFAPDGRRLFIRSKEEKRLRVYELDSKRWAACDLSEPEWVDRMFVSGGEGRYLATMKFGAHPALWDAGSLRQKYRLTDFEAQGAACLTFSTDGRQLMAGAQTGAAFVWDTETGRPTVARFEHGGWIRRIAMNRAGTHVLTSSIDATAQLWDVRMRLPAPPPPPPAWPGPEARLNHAGTRLLVSVGGDTIQVLDTAAGRSTLASLHHPDRGGRAGIWCAEFSPDDSKIFTAGAEGFLRVWDATNFRLLLDLEVTNGVRMTRFSGDGRYLIVNSPSGRATVWDAIAGTLVGETSRAASELTSVESNPVRPQFAITYANGEVRFWSLPGGQPDAATLRHRGIVWSAQYSPNGQRIVTASGDGTAQLRDTQSGQPELKPMRHDKDVLLAAFSPDGHWILTGSEDGTARVWDAATAEPVSPTFRHGGKIWKGAFSPDSRWVASGDTILHVWDPLSGLALSEPMAHAGTVARLAFHPNGKSLVTSGGQPLVWPVVVAPVPVPAWFCNLVEVLATRPGSVASSPGQIPSTVVDRIRQQAEHATTPDFYMRWARWFLVNRLRADAPPIDSVLVERD